MPIILACIITAGRSLTCRGVGGLEEAYITNHVKKNVFVNTIGNVIGGTDPVTGTILTFETLEQEVETANAVEAIVGSVENGTAVYEQSVALTLFGEDDALRTLVMELVGGRHTVLGLSQQGQHKLYGKKNGLTVNEGEIKSGLALADLNGVTITLSGKEPEPADLVDLAGDGVGGAMDEFIINAAP